MQKDNKRVEKGQACLVVPLMRCRCACRASLQGRTGAVSRQNNPHTVIILHKFLSNCFPRCGRASLQKKHKRADLDSKWREQQCTFPLKCKRIFFTMRRIFFYNEAFMLALDWIPGMSRMFALPVSVTPL